MGKISLPIINNRIIIKVVLGSGKLENGNIIYSENKPLKEYRAMIDTGSGSSIITKKIVNELKLEPLGKEKFVSTIFDQDMKTSSYEVILGIYNKEPIRLSFNKRSYNDSCFLIPTTVYLIENNSMEKDGFDMILGMNEITEGHLTISDDSFIFSI
ncbi:retropepsin-like aspartic protease [Spiroplasma ixodetis]|uniref:retropepsin-like aspartic protease n=1 Tax=Spiroplasma ixodetis TaxID=2141 RepID=UPI0025758D6B|nr:retropepsin-like aspartic protease [Spiroplasma ixodetis]WJG69618.1 hypothetical protein SIXOD_v1c05280 [Spiroplasma ixodetis Y32]